MRLLFMLVGTLLLADDRNIDFDKEANFTSFRTYSLRKGTINARGPELDSPILKRRIDAAIRSQFAFKGMEDGARPDLIITWRLGAANKRQVQSWPTGRRGFGTRHTTYNFTEGTLVIDMVEAATKQLVWRGIYRDDEDNAAKISKKIEKDIKELFDKYPPKK